MSYVAERIKAMRLASGLTLQEVANRANVSATYLRKIEGEEANPTLDIVERISRSMGYEILLDFKRVDLI